MAARPEGREFRASWSRRRQPRASGAERVFAVDVMVCSKCEGPMKVLAFLEDPKVVKGILMHLGLRAEPLPVAGSRGPPPELFEAV